MKYNHKKTEKKWQNKWLADKLYKASDKGKKYYMLVELAYSSGDLHIGHWFAWSAPDVFARYKRMQGFNVLFPVGGFDSFGLPAENAAIRHGIHPAKWTSKNVNNMRTQFASMGPSFDWDAEVVTSDPDYYKWTQWLFLKLYKKDLAYKAKILSNWCPKCKTVLANEHVVNGCCWRHTEIPVVQKKADQWMFRITKYADRLIWPKNPSVNWPRSMIEGHNNWIGKKKGINIKYDVVSSKESIEAWTSRPDTNFGATFIVLAPEHPLAKKITTKQQLPKVSKYIDSARKKTQRQRLEEAKTKTGVFTGAYAKNNLTGKRMPIWISDFVLMDFGTGAVVGVPGHDRRDFEFADKFDIPIVRVVVGMDNDKSKISKIDQVQEVEGIMINSGFLDGLDIHTATKKAMDYLVKKGWGKLKTMYHIRDWSVSRQRYWGAPIPIIYCDKCGTVSVSESDLPIKLPLKVDYTPTGKAPLATAKDFVNTKCPECGGKAKRETETMDTYVDSSWYLFRYPNSTYKKAAIDPESSKYFPIEVYFGGSEHTLGHTLYTRFITKFLKDEGVLDFGEFAKIRYNHGIIFGPDGFRMSKSRGNVVNPDTEVKKYGADAVRTYLCFIGPHDRGGPWSGEGIEGSYKFLSRIWRLVTEHQALVIEDKDEAKEVLVAMHKTTQNVSNDLEKMSFNTAIARIMEYLNVLQAKTRTSNPKKREFGCAEWNEALSVLVLLIAPYAPHMAEELWVNVLGEKYSVHTSKWPKFDPKMVKEETVEIVLQVNGKLRSTISISTKDAKDKKKVVELAKKDPKISKWIKDKKTKKEIFVPERLLNFVI